MLGACARSAAAIAVAAFLLGVTAQPAHPVKVNKCDPVEGQVVGGYVPGYYPYGPYYWRDPYGYRYHQYPYPAGGTTTAPTLNIDYVNVTPKPLKEIEFGLVAKGTLIAEVRDVGTFSHGAEIKHSFGLNPNVFPIGTGLPLCVPLRATYEDGEVWTNPHLPRLRETLYR